MEYYWWDLVGVFWLLALAAVIVVPIYLIVRVIQLGRETRALHTELNHRFEWLRVEMEHRLGAPVIPPAEFAAQATAGAATSVQQSEAPQPVLGEFHLPEPERAGWLRRWRRPAKVVAPAAVESPRSEGISRPDLESMLGAGWLAKLGIAAIAVAMAFFLQYAFKAGWIGPTARVVGGLGVSGALLVCGQLFCGKPRYRSYAEVLTSGGIVVLFLSIFAAYTYYKLIPFQGAFLILVVASLAASALALANNTRVPALLCLVGAFAAPVLIRRGSADPGDLLRLYSYLAVLNVWVLLMIRFRPWYSLPAVSLVCTWALFLGAGPLSQGNYLINQGFATLFLVFSCIPGMRALYARRESLARDAGAGLALIGGGLVAFVIATFLVLSEIGLLGLPAITLVALILALVLSGAAIAVPELPLHDQTTRNVVGLAGAAVFLILLVPSVSSAEPTPLRLAPIAFGFAVFNYAMFLGMALLMSRRLTASEPATVFVLVAAYAHALTCFHVLDRILINGVPALALWLPLAGCATIGLLPIATRKEREDRLFEVSLAVGGIALPCIGLLGALSRGANWPSLEGSLMLFLEFQLISGIWLLLRRHVPRRPIRLDVAAAFVNALVFFSLMARAAGVDRIEGLSILAAGALGMAVFLAAVGASTLIRAEDDRLVRLTYLGLALTFVTLAVPLQLQASWITLAWAMEAAVLVWTGLAVNQRRVRQAGLLLLDLTLCKALVWDLWSTPAHFHLLLNTRMLAGAAVVLAACYVTAVMRRAEGDEDRRFVAILPIAANVVAILFGSVDLWDFAGRLAVGADQHSARHLALSLFWTVYALGGVAIGIWKGLRSVRLLAMALLYIAILKVFLFDLSGLAQPFRIVSFFALGVILLLVSLLYTRFEGRLRAESGAAPAEEATVPRRAPAELSSRMTRRAP